MISLSNQNILHIVKLTKLFVYDIAFSSDAKFIALSFASSIVKIYTAETMK